MIRPQIKTVEETTRVSGSPKPLLANT